MFCRAAKMKQKELKNWKISKWSFPRMYETIMGLWIPTSWAYEYQHHLTFISLQLVSPMMTTIKCHHGVTKGWSMLINIMCLWIPTSRACEYQLHVPCVTYYYYPHHYDFNLPQWACWLEIPGNLLDISMMMNRFL